MCSVDFQVLSCDRFSSSAALTSSATQLCSQSTCQYYIFRVNVLTTMPHAQNEVICSIERKVRLMNSFPDPFIRKWQMIHYIIIFIIVVRTSLMHIFSIFIIFRAALLKYHNIIHLDNQY